MQSSKNVFMRTRMVLLNKLIGHIRLFISLTMEYLLERATLILEKLRLNPRQSINLVIDYRQHELRQSDGDAWYNCKAIILFFLLKEEFNAIDHTRGTFGSQFWVHGQGEDAW